MKKLFFTIALALLSAISIFAQNASVTFKLTGVEDGKSVGMSLIDGVNHEINHKAAIANGEVVINLTLEGPRGFYIYVEGNHTGKILVLDKGENAIVSAAYNGKEFEDLSVEGSMTYLEYYIKALDRSIMNKKYETYHKLPANVEYSNAYKEKDQEKMKAIRASEGWKDFEKAEKWFFGEVEREYRSVQEANKDSWLGPFFMMTNYAYLTKEQLPEWEKFSDEVKASFYGKACHDLIVPPSEEGKQMPDFTFTNFKSKKKTSLKDVLKKNKVVLVDFWASWCNPCRKEIPNIKANYEKYHKQGFDVVSISADQKEKDWLKALNEEKLPWWNDRDGNQGICTLYKVQYYPTIYLLDSEGKVIAKDIRGEELGKKLEEIFK